MRQRILRWPAIALALALLPGLVVPAAAETIESLDFDIFKQNDSLTVWIDFEPLLTSERVDQMKQGIDLAVQYDLSVMKPRRLWGAQKKDNFEGMFRVGYRIVTEDYFFAPAFTPPDSARHFLTLGSLAEYLTDSVQSAVCPVDSLDPSTRYYLDLNITTITLTALNLASEDQLPDQQNGSPIKYLFRKFLEVTDFGREELRFKSRLFSLSEIDRK